MDEKTAVAIQTWKEHVYKATDIPLGDAVDSLALEEPLIYARQSDTRKSDWVLCRTGTDTPATFVFAAVFSVGDPYETGNLVPLKRPVPPGMEESRVANHAGYKAAYSYAIDTYHDKDIWTLQGSLDEYMTTVHGFNSRGLKRRDWQNGSTWHPRFWFRTPMFLTCETRGGRPEAPPGLHPWVVSAHKKSTNYRANPVRPLICGLEGGRLQAIRACLPNVLEYGDVVSIVFSLLYVEDREDWGPVPMVTHIIRVQPANRETYPLTSAVVVPDLVIDDGGLRIGSVVDAEEAAAADAARERAAAIAAKARAAAIEARLKVSEAAKARAAEEAAKAAVVDEVTRVIAADDAAKTRADDEAAKDDGRGASASGGTAEPMTLDSEDGKNPPTGVVAGEIATVLVLPVMEGAPPDSADSPAIPRNVTGPAAVEGEHDDGDISGWEMDIDDEEGRHQPDVRPPATSTADDDDAGHSSDSTLAEDSADTPGGGGSRKPRTKRVRRVRGGSDDDTGGRTKMGRLAPSGRGRRGGKASK